MKQYSGITELFQSIEILHKQWRALSLPAPVPSESVSRQLSKFLPGAEAPAFALADIDSWQTRHENLISQQHNQLEHKQYQLKLAIKQLAQQHKQADACVQQEKNCLANCQQALQQLTSQQQQLIDQAGRLSHFIAQLQGDAKYKDKLKLALNQASKCKQTLLQNQHALEELQHKCEQHARRVRQLSKNQRQLLLDFKQKGAVLANVRQQQQTSGQQLRQSAKKLEQAADLRQNLLAALEVAKNIINGWSLKDNDTAWQHMQQALRRADELAAIVDRLEKLLFALDVRLPRRINALQTWHQESKNLAKQCALVESELQEIIAPLNAKNYQEHIGGQLGFKLNGIKGNLNSLLELSGKLEQQSQFLSRAIPVELERGRVWTEQWRFVAKEQRSLLTQAAAWQQEAMEQTGQAGQRLAQLVPAWLEQAGQLTPWLDIWQDLAHKLNQLEQHANVLESRQLSLQNNAMPLPRVSNLVKTPVSFKQYNAGWRRLLPEQSQRATVLAMLQTVDYWLELLSREFSNSLTDPLIQENQELALQLKQTQEEKLKLSQARQRSAVTIWQARKHKLFQQAHIGELTKVINEIGLNLNQTQSENTQLQDLLQQSRQQQLLSQARINDLLQQNLAGEQAQQNLQRLEGVLVHVRQEKEEQRLRLETLLTENTLLASQKDGLLQQILQIRQDKQKAESQLEQVSREHTQALQVIDELKVVELQAQNSGDEVLRLQGILNKFKQHQQKENHRMQLLEQENSSLRGYKIKSENLAQILKQMLDRYKQAQDHVDDLLEKNTHLTQGQALNLHLQAEIFQLRTRETQYRLRIDELEALGLHVEELEQSLKLARRAAKALKLKMLERHRLYRQTQKAMAEFNQQQARNMQLEVALAQMQEQLSISQQARAKLRDDYQAAIGQRDAARADLIQERSIRLALKQEELEKQSLLQQLEQARSDARHWRQLANDLQYALQRASRKDEVSTNWQQEAEHNATKALELEEKINQLLLRVQQQTPGTILLNRNQTGRVLGNLQQARRKLKHVSKNILHGWLLVALLSGGLLLGTPTISGTAVQPASMSALPVEQTGQPKMVPQVTLVQNNIALDVDLRPNQVSPAPLPHWLEQKAAYLARQYNLPSETIKVNALSIWMSSEDLTERHVDLQLQEMADQALAMVNSSNHIAGSLSRRALAPSNDSLTLFYAKLFDEYCSLGHSPAQALGAVSSNMWASRQMAEKSQPLVYKGGAQPLAEIETLDNHQFVERISPYIASKMQRFMEQHARPYHGQAENYARNLAMDIFQAAEAFAIPKTLMLTIAHQETFYANVLGDSNRSASPFQIFAPTKKIILQELARHGFVAPPSNIRLERHLTMATYMAAFHLKQLITKSSDKNYVYIDRLLRSYNGGSIYAGLVAKRQTQLAKYLAKAVN